MGTFNWPPARTTTWPYTRTFSRPRTEPLPAQRAGRRGPGQRPGPERARRTFTAEPV